MKDIDNMGYLEYINEIFFVNYAWVNTMMYITIATIAVAAGWKIVTAFQNY